MPFARDPKKQWHNSGELAGKYSRLSSTLNRLMLLDYVWKKLVGNKEKFWKLDAVQGHTIFVKVRVAVAKNELNARKSVLIKELNKHFKSPWIERIEIK